MSLRGGGGENGGDGGGAHVCLCHMGFAEDMETSKNMTHSLLSILSLREKNQCIALPQIVFCVKEFESVSNSKQLSENISEPS